MFSGGRERMHWEGMGDSYTNSLRMNPAFLCIFTDEHFLPDKYCQIIKISGRKSQNFFISPHECSIKRPNFKVDVNLRER